MNKKIIFIGVIVAFFAMGFLAMERAMPQKKEERIYKAITLYSPYKLEKSMGGLSIVDSRSGTKEKPSAAEVYLRLDEVQKNWGAKHLQLEGENVLVLGDNNQTVTSIHVENEKEMAFVHSFYGL